MTSISNIIGISGISKSKTATFTHSFSRNPALPRIQKEGNSKIENKMRTIRRGFKKAVEIVK